MDLKKLHDDVAVFLPESVPFCIGIDIWDHRHDEPIVMVGIWDSELNQTHEGRTPEEAFSKMRAAHDRLPKTPLSAVEHVQVP